MPEPTKLDPEDWAIPDDSIPPERVQLIASYLAHTVQKELGTKNGCTALYWHLIAVVKKHAGKKE